ncbi:MAG: FeoA domain-containing protein [bacterium]|nr:FeoA domain-containing protein [bacterium]
MTQPLWALSIAMAVGVLAVVLFWPMRGIFWRVLHSFRASERVLIEDALKHIHDYEYHQLPATLHSLSGAVSISGNRAAALLERLENLELISLSEGGYKLTPSGRIYALRVIRVHRLLERYFSDQTSLDAAEWHRRAEYHEHRTSPEEIEALSARMGNPRFDPHGDPIPTAHGDIPPLQGLPLTDLSVGQLASIVHVEDEPEAIHAQLVAEDLHPGMQVRIIESGPQRIRFETEVEEYVLAPVVAAHLWVLPLPKEQGMKGPFRHLSVIQPGERAKVIGLSPNCRGAERRRLLDLGVIPGTEITCEMKSPGGDPVAYRVRGAVIALRKEQADLIQIEEVKEGVVS